MLLLSDLQSVQVGGISETLHYGTTQRSTFKSLTHKLTGMVLVYHGSKRDQQ